MPAEGVALPMADRGLFGRPGQPRATVEGIKRVKVMANEYCLSFAAKSVNNYSLFTDRRGLD